MASTRGAGDASRRIRELEEALARETAARQRLQAELRRSEAQFRSVVSNLSEMVLAFDMERRLTFVNSAVHALTGYTPEDLKRAQFIDWLHPEDRSRMMAHWDLLFAGVGFQEEEYRLLTRDGRVKWMSATWEPILDESGRQVGVQGREREVTEHRMAEETLRLRGERYRTLFEDSPFPMWEEDFSAVKQFLDGLTAAGVADLRAHLAAHRADAAECVRRIRALDVNRAAREFYGATREELLGDLSRLFDDAAYDVACEEFGALAAGCTTFKTEFEARTTRGALRTVAMIVSLEPAPVDWSRVIVSFLDITDRKLLERELLHAQKLESLGRLAGGVAHDFNNLLMVISGYSDMLLSEGELPEGVQSALAEIRNAGRRGAELTGQLLAFSRKQHGRPRILDVNLLIRESLPMLERLIGADITLVVRLQDAPWNIKADPGQLHQVLMNLVMNAREAMPGGGTLTVDTSNFAGAEGNYLLLEIGDTGHGMDAATRQHLFEPFFTTKRGNSGTGLGLATVFGVVTQAGGHLSVRSEPGAGATFSLYFPQAAGAAPAPPEPVEASPLTRETGAVLVVEDQPEVRRLACRIVRDLGFHVLEAADGRQALSAAEHYRGPIRLMLTDMVMPGMNGKELAERLAELRPDTRVVFMSGYTDRLPGADGVLDASIVYLQKPFHAQTLSAAIRRALYPLEGRELT